jgi:hypothetical protein
LAYRLVSVAVLEKYQQELDDMMVVRRVLDHRHQQMRRNVLGVTQKDKLLKPVRLAIRIGSVHQSLADLAPFWLFRWLVSHREPSPNHQLEKVIPTTQLDGTNVYQFGTRPTRFLQEMQQVEELYLAFNHVTDVCDLMGMEQLTIVVLENNQLPDISAIEILSLFPSLKALALSGNPGAAIPNYRQLVWLLLLQLMYLDEKRPSLAPEVPQLPVGDDEGHRVMTQLIDDIIVRLLHLIWNSALPRAD